MAVDDDRHEPWDVDRTIRAAVSSGRELVGLGVDDLDREAPLPDERRNQPGPHRVLDRRQPLPSD